MNDFQDFILVIIISMFIVLRNYMSNEQIVYILFFASTMDKFVIKKYRRPKDSFSRSESTRLNSSHERRSRMPSSA